MFLKSNFKRISLSFLIMFFLISLNIIIIADEASDLASDMANKKQMMSDEIAVITEQHIEFGKKLISEGEYDRALDEFNTVLDVQPDSQEAKKFRMKCINALATDTSPAVYTTESDEISSPTGKTLNQTKALDAYRKGLHYLKLNQKDVSINYLNKSVYYDPYYVPAKRLLKRVLELEEKDIMKDQKVLWRERMNNVDKAWLPTEKANKLTSSSSSKYMMDITHPAKRRMIEAADQIIPEINFTQAHLRDVLQYLSKITGVNIILDENVFSGNFTGEDEGEDVSPTINSADTITISLTNIPLIEALRYILKIKGLKFRIDNYAILVSTPEKIGSDEMETRYYKLSSGIGEFTEFKTSEEGAVTGEVNTKSMGSFEMEIEDKIGIKDVLMNSGVPFPESSSVFMDKRTGTLIVHNTPENLSMVEKILEIIDKVPFQVNIQAKFVRISQNDLEELGFEWLLSSPIRVGPSEGGANKWQIDQDNRTEGVFVNNALGDTTYTDVTGSKAVTTGAVNGISETLTNFIDNSSIMAFSGILTDPQFKVVMHALDKNGNTDLLSAPSVTTVNNQQAQIELVDEIIYPGEYDLQAPTINESGSAITPGMAVPGDFLTRDVGVILNVTPSVGSDRRTITLTLIPEVSELVGWKDFGVTFTNTVPYADGVGSFVNIDNSQHIPMEQPIFRTSNVSTTVIVNDGETVVLGGLIEEKKFTAHDKIPFLGSIPILGRLFRHDYDQTRKMNLMIFVTAKLIDASGEDLHQSRS